MRVDVVRLSRYQVERDAHPDTVHDGQWYLLKYVSRLRLTYQIRVLADRAGSAGARLVVRVPTGCRLSRPLREFVTERRDVVRIERVAG